MPNLTELHGFHWISQDFTGFSALNLTECHQIPSAKSHRTSRISLNLTGFHGIPITKFHRNSRNLLYWISQDFSQNWIAQTPQTEISRNGNTKLHRISYPRYFTENPHDEMPWNWIYMGNFWVQIFTELSRKSQDYTSQKRRFHIKLIGPKSHWIPRKSSQNVKYWQNITDLRYQAVKFHRISSSQNFTESSKIKPHRMVIPRKIIGTINTELPQNSLSSKCLKAKKILAECYCWNLTGLRYQAMKFHRTSSSRNLTGQKSHRRAWGEFSLECILYSPFLLTITYFSHDDFHWIQGSRDVFDFPSLSGKPRNSRNSVFYSAWPLYPLETGLLSIRK